MSGQVNEQSKQHAASGTGAKLNSPPLLRVFVAQLAVLSVVSASLSLLDIILGKSALIGGLIAVLPNAFFARQAFRFSGARAAPQVARSFYLGEAGKFVMTAIMFAVTFALFQPLRVEVLFLVYIVMMALNWMLALRFFRR